MCVLLSVFQIVFLSCVIVQFFICSKSKKGAASAATTAVGPNSEGKDKPAKNAPDPKDSKHPVVKKDEKDENTTRKLAKKSSREKQAKSKAQPFNWNININAEEAPATDLGSEKEGNNDNPLASENIQAKFLTAPKLKKRERKKDDKNAMSAEKKQPSMMRSLMLESERGNSTSPGGGLTPSNEVRARPSVPAVAITEGSPQPSVKLFDYRGA